MVIVALSSVIGYQSLLKMPVVSPEKLVALQRSAEDVRNVRLLLRLVNVVKIG